MGLGPVHDCRKYVNRYKGSDKIKSFSKSFSSWDPFLCRAFALPTYRESSRDIEACLTASQAKLYHLGIRGRAHGTP